MITLATVLSALSLLMSALFFIHLRAPFGWLGLFPKLAASGLSPAWAILGAVGAVLGWLNEAYWAIPMGILGAGMMTWYVWRCTRDHNGFEKAFGAGWQDQIPPAQNKQLVKRRWSTYLKMKASPQPIWKRNVPFWTIPDSDRQLLCDIWRPGDGDHSGLAFVYCHGGAWVGDKDFLTRPFFNHLTAQGHTVMDVAYRLCPEVDIHGMIGDVKRAIAWMKANADRYGVDPDKVVLGGASAGGHLALLAGYTPEHPELTPDDLKVVDLSVRGVVSFYGPTDLLVFYHYMNLHRTANQPPVPIGKDPENTKGLRYAARMDILLGGHPQDALSTYQLASPITHVDPGCPPTLLIQGNHDLVASAEATNALYRKLVECGVPAINVVYPRTPHAFDALFPQINPAAQSALYDVDRFLALMANKNCGTVSRLPVTT